MMSEGYLREVASIQICYTSICPIAFDKRAKSCLIVFLSQSQSFNIFTLMISVP